MANTVAQKKTGTPPINADPPVLGPTKYPGPQGRPVRPVRKRPLDVASWVQGSKRPPRSGGKPPQGPEQGPTLDTGDNSYKPYDGPPPPMGGDNYRNFKPDWQQLTRRGFAGDGGYDIGMGMKDPRAGGLNKRTGEWTPPDPAYLEGLKNGTIEPEWKRRERMWQGAPGQSGPHGGINPGGGAVGGGRPMPISQVPQNIRDLWKNGGGSYGDIKGMPGQGGEQVPGGQAIGGPKPVYSNSGGGTLGSQNGGTVGGGPVGGGRPGRQPLRPGMEYRPGGGQRPVGGGMQGAPQDGGMDQFTAVGTAVSNGNDPYRAQRVSDMYGVDSTGWYDGNGQLTDQGNQGWENYNQANQNGGAPAGGAQGDPQEQMRRRLMMMQKQGPNSNPYYGAF